MSAPIPPPRSTGRYRVGLVCLGNICRSPMAEVVLSAVLAGRGLADAVDVDSVGTGDWHVGQPMDTRAAQALRARGYDGSAHRARQIPTGWIGGHDLVLAMDRSNLLAVLDLGGDAADRSRVRMFRSFDPAVGADAGAGDDGNVLEVPDPWYGTSTRFDEVLDIVERTADALADAVAGVVAARP